MNQVNAIKALFINKCVFYYMQLEVKLSAVVKKKSLPGYHKIIMDFFK